MVWVLEHPPTFANNRAFVEAKILPHCEIESVMKSMSRRIMSAHPETTQKSWRAFEYNVWDIWVTAQIQIINAHPTDRRMMSPTTRSRQATIGSEMRPRPFPPNRPFRASDKPVPSSSSETYGAVFLTRQLLSHLRSRVLSPEAVRSVLNEFSEVPPKSPPQSRAASASKSGSELRSTDEGSDDDLPVSPRARRSSSQKTRICENEDEEMVEPMNQAVECFDTEMVDASSEPMTMSHPTSGMSNEGAPAVDKFVRSPWPIPAPVPDPHEEATPMDIVDDAVNMSSKEIVRSPAPVPDPHEEATLMDIVDDAVNMSSKEIVRSPSPIPAPAPCPPVTLTDDSDDEADNFPGSLKAFVEDAGLDPDLEILAAKNVDGRVLLDPDSIPPEQIEETSVEEHDPSSDQDVRPINPPESPELGPAEDESDLDSDVIELDRHGNAPDAQKPLYAPCS
jgi:hypothetical protein